MALVWLYKRGKRYYLRYSPKVGGGRKSLGDDCTKDEAEEACINERKRLKKGEQSIFEDASPGGILYEDLCAKFLEAKVGAGRSESTLGAIKAALNNFGEHLGRGVPAKDIGPEDLEAFMSARRTLGRMPKTIHSEVVVLSGLFKWAVKRKHLRENPVGDVEKPTVPKNPPVYLRREEWITLLSKIDDEAFRDYVEATLWLAVRRGEGIVLEANGVDLERGIVTCGQPKTKDYKELEIYHPDMERVLRRLLLRCGGKGRLIPISADNMGRRFKEYVKGAGLPWEPKDPMKITLHKLRHTIASWLHMKGVSPAAIQHLLGHRDIKTTMRYLHVHETNLRAQMEKLGESAN
jgi:site-specific recombinase XerD